MSLSISWLRMMALAFMFSAVGIAQASPASDTASSPLPMGKGPGYHSPLSAFKPLQELAGVVSWRDLGSVTTRLVKGRLEPVFPDPVKALHQTRVKVQGFMMPLEAGTKQRHFLLSAVPTTCPYCVPAGPEGLIEVRTKVPVSYSVNAFFMEGVLQVLQDDDMGLYYRLTEAAPTQP